MSTRGRQNKKTQSLLSCNRKALHLPDNVPAVHLQFTEYYFPDNPSLSGITQLYFILYFVMFLFIIEDELVGEMCVQFTHCLVKFKPNILATSFILCFISCQTEIYFLVVIIKQLTISCITIFCLIPSFSAHLKPVLPVKRPAAMCGPSQCVMDQSVLQGSTAHSGPGQSFLPFARQ